MVAVKKVNQNALELKNAMGKLKQQLFDRIRLIDRANDKIFSTTYSGVKKRVRT